ncbi:MFS transporter [Schumannella sp. 10F1B-5-1]|uniref:MFS transporter n=1 Tax=Schumannella sp. 10F1B-5-1 TaxID=2590780 RepID=UPI0011320B63|nr:MFS transporter [Schumannella sp. 10F1B-5-1]TPW70646.1 MFS transporter [Schumannella sp. 10F1B-5-1]
MVTTPPPVAPSRGLGAVTFSLVGFLFLVELASGILQGYYVPLISDIVRHLGIHDADFNWFEAGQLLLAAATVPLLAKLGDMFGHRKLLLGSIAVTALAAWALVLAQDFTTFLIAWSLQGVAAVWLPLEVALIFDRGRRTGTAASATRRSAGLLVVALEVGAIAGALGGGRLFSALGEQVAPTLVAPAVVVSLVFFAVLFGVPESEPLPGRRLDGGGFALLALSLILITGGLTFLRLNGPGAWWVWACMLAGLLVLVPWARHELRHPDPGIDLRTLGRRAMWPVQLTAGLFGISVLGAQVPLSTYAGTDPANGYGLGLDAGDRSIVIGIYLVALIVGAAVFAALSRRVRPRSMLLVAALLVAAGYLLFVPFHLQLWQVLTNMVIVGLGGGALVAALPSAAAAAAPRGQTGVATGLTNTTKTIGGSFASSIFGVVLATGAGVTVASLAGYLTVWIVCGIGALAAFGALLLVPRSAFSDAEQPPVATPAEPHSPAV